MLASLVRYFYPSPLTNTLCFAGRCLGKKKKCCSLVSVRFVILLPGFVRMVEELPRSVRHVISFCNSRWSVLWYTLRYRFLFAFYMCKGQKPPAKTPPEACYNLFLSVIYHLYLGIKNRSLVYGTDRTFQYVRVCHYNTSVIF